MLRIAQGSIARWPSEFRSSCGARQRGVRRRRRLDGGAWEECPHAATGVRSAGWTHRRENGGKRLVDYQPRQQKNEFTVRETHKLVLVVQHDVADVVIDVDGDDDGLRRHCAPPILPLLPHASRRKAGDRAARSRKLTARAESALKTISDGCSSARKCCPSDSDRSFCQVLSILSRAEPRTAHRCLHRPLAISRLVQYKTHSPRSLCKRRSTVTHQSLSHLYGCQKSLGVETPEHHFAGWFSTTSTPSSTTTNTNNILTYGSPKAKACSPGPAE